MRHVKGKPTFAVLAAAAVALVTTSAGAAPADVDLRISVAATTVLVDRTPAPIPNGGSATVTSTSFVVYVFVAPRPARAKVRVELGDGLHWGTTAPDPSDQCTSTATTAECDASALTGGNQGWYWDVVAARTGSYPYKAAIVEASEPDPDPTNNATSITIVVTAPAGGGGTGGGGGTAAVSASAVKLTPARPKAGSAVVATVRVTAGGTPVTPTGLRCAGTVGATQLTGKGKATSGAAACVYRTTRSAKGKTLRGTISFRARGTKFTRRFSAKLG
jgi:hypothetical protein